MNSKPQIKLSLRSFKKSLQKKQLITVYLFLLLSTTILSCGQQKEPTPNHIEVIANSKAIKF